MSEKTFEVKEVFKRIETLEGSMEAEPSKIQYERLSFNLEGCRRKV